MTFSNPRGTRGAGMPGGPLFRWVNKVAARRAKRSDKRIMGMRVRARELHGDARAEAWSRTTAESEQFAGYQRETDREIPVVELTPSA